MASPRTGSAWPNAGLAAPAIDAASATASDPRRQREAIPAAARRSERKSVRAKRVISVNDPIIGGRIPPVGTVEVAGLRVC